jgi:hypothetical protein
MRLVLLAEIVILQFTFGIVLEDHIFSVWVDEVIASEKAVSISQRRDAHASPFFVQMLQLQRLIVPLPSGASASSSVTVYLIRPQWQLPLTLSAVSARSLSGMTETARMDDFSPHTWFVELLTWSHYCGPNALCPLLLVWR